MNEFDKYIKEKIDEENLSVPDSIKERIEQSVSALPARESKVINSDCFRKQ